MIYKPKYSFFIKLHPCLPKMYCGYSINDIFNVVICLCRCSFSKLIQCVDSFVECVSNIK